MLFKQFKQASFSIQLLGDFFFCQFLDYCIFNPIDMQPRAPSSPPASTAPSTSTTSPPTDSATRSPTTSSPRCARTAVGMSSESSPALFRWDEDQLLHHLRDRGGFKTTFRSLRFERMGKYPFAMSNFHRSQRNVVSQTTMAWSPCIRLGRGCDNVEENT